MEYLRRCDSVLFLRNYRNSSGSLKEEQEAKRLGIPCFYEEHISLFWDWMDQQVRAA